MKRIILSIFALCCLAMTASATKVYINPGHGSWGANCRPMATINYAAGDTLGFFESNTNLWKSFMLEEKLKAAGYGTKMSRRASGGSGTNEFNKALSTICTEAENYGADYYISIHSNAGPEGELGGANGKFANYPVILYRGYTGTPKVAKSDKMSKACVTRLYEAFWTTPGNKGGTGKDGGPEPTTYYSPSNPRVVGDLSFYNTSSTYGYLGALKHNIPGYLSEGYFHTYSPARHRALSPEWCRQEGVRYFRGIQDYYGKAGESVGYIMGYVRSKTEKFSHKYYIPYTGSNDEYKPINGAKIVLRNEAGEVIKTNCYNYVKRMLKNQDYYTTDHNYNGVFVFENLKPGKYTLYVYAKGYKDYTQTVTVTADKTIYPQIFMEVGTGSSEPNVGPINPDITWELNGGYIPGGKVPTQEELWSSYQAAAGLSLGTLAELKAAGEGKPHDKPDNQCACRRICGTLDDAKVKATFEKKEWAWLKTYIMGVQSDLTDDLSKTAAAWRYAIAAFFLQSQHSAWPASADFSTAGKPEAWGDAYLSGTGTSAELPHSVSTTYTLPTPERDGYIFEGWYNNPEGTGTALTSIPAGWKGTLYAIWREADPADVTWVLNGGNIEGTLPRKITDAPYTIPTPTRTGYVFLGWYDNREGTGSALTTLPVGWKGTVYAKWREAKVAWVLNGGKVMEEVTVSNGNVTVPNNEDLFTTFMKDYNSYYNTSINTANYSVAKGNVDNFLYNGKALSGKEVDVRTILADAKNNWKWLGDYVQKVSTAAGSPLEEEIPWRYSLAAFFESGPASDYSVDFSNAGQPDVWGDEYLAAKGGLTTKLQEVTLPSKITGEPYTIPTPVKENDEFIGWYDSANGTGEPLTVLPVGYDGTVYAIWKSGNTATEMVENQRPILDINAPMYDVLGRQVDATYRGIIIQNGNKYLLR